MKWKLLTLAALVTAAVVLFSGKLFDIPTGREEESKEIVLVDIPSAAIPATPTAPETPSERPAWDPWANSDGSFDELKLARVPSANELLTPTFTKEEIEKIDREPHEGNGRTLMIMAFERTERSTKNVEFLINQVVGGRRAKDIDFIFVDTSKEGPYKCFPQLPNVMYVHRERVGFDICSYKVGLAIAPPGRYKYVVLMNGSVRGPFTTDDDFLAIFKEQLDSQTPVVGTSVNCGPRLHVQSMFFMMNSVGADLMNATLSCDIPNYHAAGSGPHGELNLSGNVLQAGFNLRAVQLLWRGMNMKDQSMLRRTCSLVGNDPYAPGRDRDPKTLQVRDIDPDDVLFYKTTRKVGQERLKNLTKVFDEECAPATGEMLAGQRDNCGLRNFSLTSCR